MKDANSLVLVERFEDAGRGIATEKEKMRGFTTGNGSNRRSEPNFGADLNKSLLPG